MIGNDVVDLALASKESNWKRKGFLQKIFSKSERSQIEAAQNPEVKVWELWSRKEAAYKIWNRESGIRLFNPIRFECLGDVSGFGKVLFEDRIYFTRTIVSKALVQTIAVCEKSQFDRIVCLQNRMGIVKKNNIPFLNNRAVSISHHGRFESIISIL